MAEVARSPYVAFDTLDQARADRAGVVVLEGDGGGQIHVVVPAQQVLCAREALSLLLRDVERISWPGNDDNSARIVFERVAVGTRSQAGWTVVSLVATRGSTPSWFGWDSTTRSALFCAASLTG